MNRRGAYAGGRVLGAALDPTAPPYMSGIIDELHSEQRVTLDPTNVQSWASRLGLYTPAQATAGQRPTYGVDGAFFNGKNVVQCDIATPRFLISPSAGQIFPPNSRPYVATIARIRALPAAGFNGVFAFTNSPGSTNDPGLYANSTTLQTFWPNAGSISAGPVGTNPALLELYYDETGTLRMAVNLNVVASEVPGKFAAGGATKLAIGANGGASNFNNASFAFQRACIALPPLAERGALMAWGTSYWDLPPPLPASAVELWRSDKQCTAATWTGQIGGRVLPGVNTPVVAADGTHFAGRVVAQTDRAGLRAWGGAGLAALATTGQRPYVLCIARCRTLPSNELPVWWSSGAVAGEFSRQGVRHNVPAYWECETQTNPGTVALADSASGAADTSPHVFESIREASLFSQRVSGVVVGSNTSGNALLALTANVTEFYAGRTAALATTTLGDMSIACILYCSARPTDAEIAAFKAWAAAYYNVS